ncbi:MAG: lipoyl(octanoyl) transferase LipB, partial [Gammaproteobacteria bacterium]|nr:lipoyl(octanoyl) transferase LipB [Gammaproteobacteria bacterium]
MQEFTAQRDADTEDEIWLLQHEPVFTQGMNGKPEHILNRNNIPVVEIDRGGQVTYHGPGQIIVYCLIDLKRKKFGIRQMVSALEQAVIDYLADEKITAIARKDAPGVYVNNAKISALGLRV